MWSSPSVIITYMKEERIVGPYKLKYLKKNTFCRLIIFAQQIRFIFSNNYLFLIALLYVSIYKHIILRAFIMYGKVKIDKTCRLSLTIVRIKAVSKS